MALKKVGMHADGGGLYLRVRSETARSWIFVWHAEGKRREMGLDSRPKNLIPPIPGQQTFIEPVSTKR